MSKTSKKRKIKLIKSRLRANISLNKNSTCKKILLTTRPNSMSTLRSSPSMKPKNNKGKKPKNIRDTMVNKQRLALLLIPYKPQLKV